LLLVGLFSSNHSIIAFIAHTKPADNIPSKNTDKILLSPIKSAFGEKYANDKKKPTHVDVHKTQEIRPDRNLPKKLNGDNGLLPQLCMDCLNPPNIDP
jgi:disulfide oxidoreductase YuzD